jgi:hypothetical protein
MMKRDRSNVPHVPARRASDLESQVAPQRQTQTQTQTLPPSAQTQLAQIQPSQAKAALQPPTQAGMPPVRAVPVSPVQEQPLSVVAHNRRPDQGQAEIPPPNMAAPSVQTARLTTRKSGGLNPFDPDNMPQGSVLPLTDPRGGNAPEIARASTNAACALGSRARCTAVARSRRIDGADVDVRTPCSAAGAGRRRQAGGEAG